MTDASLSGNVFLMASVQKTLIVIGLTVGGIALGNTPTPSTMPWPGAWTGFRKISARLTFDIMKLSKADAIKITCPTCQSPPGKYCKFPIPGAFAGIYDWLCPARRKLP